MSFQIDLPIKAIFSFFLISKFKFSTIYLHLKIYLNSQFLTFLYAPTLKLIKTNIVDGSINSIGFTPIETIPLEIKFPNEAIGNFTPSPIKDKKRF